MIIKTRYFGELDIRDEEIINSNTAYRVLKM